MQHQRITAKNLDKASFRYASPDDLDRLVPVYERFYEEAIYKDYIDWDRERATQTIDHGIRNHVRPHILAVVDGEIVGFICWQLDHSFSVKPVAVMFEFYVVPEHRRSAIGKFLLRLMCWVVKDDGACAVHAPVASGMDATRSLFNMFVKEGFEGMGVSFIARRKL